MTEQSPVHTVDLLEEALAVAQQLGFEIRREWLSGRRGGACRIGERQLLFVDLSLSATEQLDQVVEPLRKVAPSLSELTVTPHLRRLLVQLPETVRMPETMETHARR